MEQATLPRATPAATVQMQEQALTSIRALPVLLSIITLALGLLYLAVIPPWAGPDEPRHYEYVRLLYEKNRFVGYPDVDKGVMEQVIRSMDSVNYWKWGVSAWKRTQPDELPKDFEAIYPAAAHQLHQPPLAYLMYLPALRAFADRPLTRQLYAMRLISILLNIVTVLAAYVAGRELFREDPTMALAVPVFVMLLPQHLFLHSTVMNDHLAEAALAWMLAVMVRTFRLGLSLPRVIAIVLLLGIGLAAKRNALYGLPIVGFAFVAYALTHWGRRMTATQKSIRLALTVIVIALGAVGAVWAWNWIGANIPKLSEYIVKLFLFLPSEQFPWEFDPRMIALSSLPHYASYLKRIFVSMWGHFGWMNITLGVQAYWAFAALCVLAFIGLVLYAVRDFQKLAGWQRAALVTFAAAIGFAFLLILGIEIRYWTLGWDAGSQGRYLFPVLIPLATLFLLGTRAFVPRPHYLVWFGGMVAAMVLYNIVALGVFIIPFYRA
jgi:uncharacterized membrane protein YfbV (UPF0208 family)